MIFQEPMSALNPVFTVGDQVAEVARVHGEGSRQRCVEPRRRNARRSREFHRPRSERSNIRISYPAECGSEF